MTWRAMASLLTLRDQVNAIAPYRSKASDGLVGDAAHQVEQSDHNPHYVAGVGSDIVTALDLTHDPDHGFDSYAFAETLRQHRDKRIKYVISNRRIFSSYAVGTTPAWTWRTYSGTDPHTNHVHISVLDAVISDTSTPWNLEGFDVSLSTEEHNALMKLADQGGYMDGRLEAMASGREQVANVPGFNGVGSPVWLVTAVKNLTTLLDEVLAELDEIKAKLPGSAIPGTAPVPLQISGTISGSVSGSFSGQGTAQ